jgi:vancomycin resistance protein YoaR
VSKRVAVVVAGVLLLAGALLLARAVDHRRGVSLAGDRVDDAASAVAELARGYGATHVVVHAPGGNIRATAAELGLSVDEDATRRSVREAQDAGPVSWVRGLLERRSAAVIVRVDIDITRSLLRARDPSHRRDPVEPSLMGTEDGIELRPGKPGRGLDAVEVADALRAGARRAHDTIEVEVAPVPLPPRFSRAQAARLAAEARRLTSTPLAVRAATASAEIGSKTLRSWIRSTDDLELSVDGKTLLHDLAEAMPEADVDPVDATVRIEAGHPVVIAGKSGTHCCTDAAPDRVLAALLHRPAGALTLPVAVRQPQRTTEEARSLRIDEIIGTFTTNHPRGQPRVTNIHRIADLVDGTIIEPGKRLAINKLVGERTIEKGFVLGGTIVDGSFTETVGGGVSQFATTLFNAAFFAGLDIPAYRSHSIYISRYPFGREATLSWPTPDLVIANTTPYGVLVDVSYTSSSITVTLWSTRYATGEQTNQTQAPVGNCTRVTTERTRTFVDGQVKVDRFHATYRPEEGVKCE